MTPRKCEKHEQRPGERADSARYAQALRDSVSCWRCRALAAVAVLSYRWNRLRGTEKL